MRCKVCNNILVPNTNYPEVVHIGIGICNECFMFIPDHVPNSQVDKFFIVLKEKNENDISR